MGSVEAVLNYLAPMEERPAYYMYEPPAGTPWRNTHGDRRTLTIHDARSLERPPTLDREGFALVRQSSAAHDLYDDDEVQRTYYPEVERLVREHTGAERVLVFDHNQRSGEVDGPAPGAERGAVAKPVLFVHNDYTEASGPQRVRDLVGGDEAESLIAGRFAVINVWRPIRGPIEESPLAFCDARTIDSNDLLGTDLKYRDRTGEIYSFRFRDEHRWYYYPRMQADEVLLLKCFDSDRERARFTAHSAFDDPTTPPDALPRESIEVRTLAFYSSAA